MKFFNILLARNFGFGIKNDAFEQLAKSLPLKYILKHNNSIAQIEALFLWQTGLFQDKTIQDDYYLSLQKEYHFLSKKYGLQHIEFHIFKNMRIRPNNFPYTKIIQLSEFVSKRQNLFSLILEMENIKDFQSLFFQK